MPGDTAGVRHMFLTKCLFINLISTCDPRHKSEKQNRLQSLPFPTVPILKAFVVVTPLSEIKKVKMEYTPLFPALGLEWRGGGVEGRAVVVGSL